MIQVCSQCGTRWNVRDRRRVWCPRCNGPLLPPSSPGPGASFNTTTTPAAPPSRPPGYRWIAVRPGAPPAPRRRRLALGPTPRYATIPRWGLLDQVELVDHQQEAPRTGPSAAMLRGTLLATMAALGAAALLHLLRYVLLIVNRSVLLHPWIAAGATWLGVAASVIAMFMVVASLIVLTNWLVARRAAAYAHRGTTDPRPGWHLQAGCLLPFVNLFWAPVFVLELAGVEERLSWLRRPIVAWWLVWLASYVVSIWSIATSFTQDAQGIADNTMTTTVAYLLALAALLLAAKVVLGFERQPVERPTKRWVVLPEDQPRVESDVPVESHGQNPAA
ncbi:MULTISPECIES: DUF4328 domain-containing protein [unclassified Mycobacterium]|uniref:DUF4328 domain-containing protein n=1 Tax=unclassified Mycobacterium TaxID=2642494 RepID=UPI00073FFCAE|nr:MULTISPECIES: DUF4328 domain-containing protein [unclassified Mycobacterium]KUH85799.1 hypothetical protein AU186_24070 [Mycobacterium sp. GA-1999]KUH91655.1 hypothetical protein AU185_11135 [Mycobacterium sp. GA-0227b]KUH96106.1 hypothetical protein AU187_12795 [Mycobacterium sp. IS-1556]